MLETIVFDLDETLIHSKDEKDPSSDLEIDL